MARNRGSKPGTKTALLVYARAAGRCQFRGCNRNITEDLLTGTQDNFANIAHIIASSPHGPRGSSMLSHEKSDQLENLILLCPEHHKLIDAHPKEYSVEMLMEMKNEHEQRINEACDAINAKETEIIRFSSPIKGAKESSININAIKKDLLPDRRPQSAYGVVIKISAAGTYTSTSYWMECSKSLEEQVNRKILNRSENDIDSAYSIFALAPIPLLIKFGSLLSDKVEADIFQKTRFPDTWKWLKREKTNNFTVQREVIREGKRIALIISLSAEVSLKRVIENFDADIIYHIRAKNMCVDCIRSLEDLSAFWHLYMKVCEMIKDEAEAACVFPAVPVSVAIEMGRRYMPGVHPKLRIFDDCNGFFEALSIGGKE